MNITLLRQKSAGRLLDADDPAEAERWLYNLCLAPTTTWAGGKPRFGHQPLFNTLTKTFPPGLIDLVRDVLVADGHTVEVRDVRGTPPALDWAALDGTGLRDYQLAAIRVALESTGGIIKAATGAGKSWIASGITLVASETTWMVVVHRETIRAQLHADLVDWLPGEDVGYITSDGFKPSRVTTTTFDALKSTKWASKVGAFLASVEGIIVDEAHVSAAKTLSALIARCVNAYYRLGMSATPLDRSDGRSIVAVAYLGKVLIDVKASDLIDQGVLARPYITFVPYRHPQTYGVKYVTSYKAGVAKNPKRDDLVVSLVARAPKPCIVFFKDIPHGRALTRKLEQAGHNVMFIDGGTDKAVRSSAASRVKYGDVDVIVASVVFNEGVNIPELASAVNAAAGKSVIQFLQRIGRVMRKVDGKDYALVYDILDTGDRFLERHATDRLAALRREKHVSRMALTVEDAMAPW